MPKKPILKLGKKYDTAIEIDSSHLKIIQAEVSGKGTVVSRLIAEPISGLSGEATSALLSEILSSKKMALNRLAVVISRDRVMVRYLQLPTAKSDEIDNMVSFEVTRQIPYSKEEVISDYKVIGVDDKGYSTVLLAVVHKNEIAKINNTLASIGRKADRITLSSESILGWARNTLREQLIEKTVCLIDIDTDTTEIVIISGGRLNFSRASSIGAVNILSDTPDDAKSRRFIEEIRRSIAMYVKERGSEASDISEFLITGAESVIEKMSSVIQREMDTPSRHMNTLSALTVADGALPEEGISAESSVCAVCGSIFSLEGLNLIPQDERRKEKARAKAKNVIALSVSVFIGLALLSAAAMANLYQKEHMLSKIGSMLKKIDSETKATEAKLQKLTVIKERFSEGAASLDVIYHLYRLIPSSINLLDFNYDDSSRTVRFRGTAVRMSDVFKLATILEDSDIFSAVQTRSVSKRRTREGEIVDFQIKCSFMPEKLKQ
ncbi:MAG: pilus assembly protein PilM [Candidatus Omnitrophica bacterium]|nr:pilus assembly protein PilM [Candidatus Omnitrophota bacterium]